MPKISALTSLAQASVDTAADVLPIVDATAPATTKKVTVQAMVNAGLAAAAPQGGIFALTGALTVSGTSTLGVTRASAADGAITFGVAGTTRGVRILTSSYGSAIEGVDNTLAASYQPLNIVASALGLYTVGSNNISFGTNSNVTQAYVTPNATAVNALVIAGGSTGNAVSLSTTGSDANRGITLTPAGAGVVTAAGAFAVTGQASFAAGTAAAPSVKVGAEQNGLYSSAANTLDVTLNGVRQAQFAYTASAVNYWSISGSAAGGFSNILESIGTDSNIQNLYASKGTYGHVFRTGGSGGFTQFVINATASAVNYFQVTGAATTGQPGLISTGTDANVSSAFSTKGTGYHYFSTNSFADVQFAIASVPSAVNRLQVQGGTAGFGPTIYVDGADTNTQLTISSKGTGSVLISTNTAGSIALQALHVASAVNWVRVQGSATGVASFVSVQGADTNASIVVAAKGSGAVGLYTGGGVNPQVLVTHTASAVNYLNFTGAATGNAVTISTGGSDSNRSISLTAAGTGLVQITNDSLRIVTSKTPASAAATGTQGQISWDADYIYVCTATDTWKRAALATW